MIIELTDTSSREVASALLDARQRELAIRPQQRETFQRLRQRQQVAFVAVAQQLTGGIIKMQVVLFCPRRQPSWQLRIFRRLTAHLNRAAGQGGYPGGIFLRFGELITAND